MHPLYDQYFGTIPSKRRIFDEKLKRRASVDARLDGKRKGIRYLMVLPGYTFKASSKHFTALARSLTFRQ